MNCLGRFTKGICLNKLVHNCPDEVMFTPVIEGLAITATFSATTVTQGSAITIGLSANIVRTAWAERGTFTGDTACAGNTETRLVSNGGVGTSLTWTAPTNYAGPVLLTLVTTSAAALGAINRETWTITVEPASNSPTNEPTPATNAPTSSEDVSVELLNYNEVTETATIGDTIFIVTESTGSLYLNRFTPTAGQGGDVVPANPCETTGGNLLIGTTVTGEPFYNGILGADGFTTAIPVGVGSPTSFDDLLDGRGPGNYEFVKQDCSVVASPNCCNAGNPAEQARLTLNVITPTTSPTSAPVTSAPTSSPTGGFVLPVIEWKLPYEGPTVYDVKVGDRVTLDIIDFSHNIIEIPTLEEFINCDFTNAEIVRDGLFFPPTTVGAEIITMGLEDLGRTRWLTCNRTTAPNPNNHCLRGQKLALRVAERGEPEEVTWFLGGDYSAGLDLEVSSTIDFKYNPAAHSVVKFATKEDFDNCTLGAATPLTDNEYASGNRVRLGSEAGSVEWYGCGVGLHCANGQKVAVRLAASAEPAPPDAPIELGLMEILTIGTAGAAAVAMVLAFGLRQRSSVSLDSKYSTGLQNIGLAPEDGYDSSTTRVKESSPFHESIEASIPYSMSTSNPRRQIDSSDLKF